MGSNISSKEMFPLELHDCDILSIHNNGDYSYLLAQSKTHYELHVLYWPTKKVVCCVNILPCTRTPSSSSSSFTSSSSSSCSKSKIVSIQGSLLHVQLHCSLEETEAPSAQKNSEKQECGKEHVDGSRRSQRNVEESDDESDDGGDNRGCLNAYLTYDISHPENPVKIKEWKRKGTADVFLPDFTDFLIENRVFSVRGNLERNFFMLREVIPQLYGCYPLAYIAGIFYYYNAFGDQDVYLEMVDCRRTTPHRSFSHLKLHGEDYSGDTMKCFSFSYSETSSYGVLLRHEADNTKKLYFLDLLATGTFRVRL
jgi:hypothetical protein